MPENHEDKLKSILEVYNMYLLRWLKLLCSTDELFELFTSRFLDVEDLEESIYIFYDYLKSTGCHTINPEKLQRCINSSDENFLHKTLEEMLLVPINNNEMSKFKKVVSRGIVISEFLEICKAYGCLRLSKIMDEYLLR